MIKGLSDTPNGREHFSLLFHRIPVRLIPQSGYQVKAPEY